ncbi:hypothetical protein [Colwellia sp. PAMC 21821]|uniref:hypothetical protein n=1 Tax=Colwellia sp. PAMC 21821 TaxID=1816219 RepID=UPI0009BF8110|nr:hypothetical protein [Colwellia sp. PAMC 21821]ARD43637.1 hypothetical protein A3Q33_04545 [Colwellia sp. PAMC 21821]
MALSAVEVLNHVIDVSQTLLKLLDASDVEGEKLADLSADQEDINSVKKSNLLGLIKVREEKIHQLFADFSSEELQLHKIKLQSVKELDNEILEKVKRTLQSAKGKILTLKQNKKAINQYQKL